MNELSPEARAALQSAFDLAVRRHRAGDHAAAEALYGQVLLLNPRHAGALGNLGAILLARNHAADARSLLAAAVELAPRDIDAWQNLGIACFLLERHEEGIGALRRALALDPRSKTIQHNLAKALRDTGQFGEATAIYQRLIAADPLDIDALIGEGTLALARGDFSGWRGLSMGHWSAEWLLRDRPIMVPLPAWDGSDLAARSVLLYEDQGIGDEIMYASMVPEIAARAARTLLVCEPRLLPLFARSFPGVTLLARPPGRQPPVLDDGRACDWRSVLSQLPRHLRPSRASFSSEPWLAADPDAVAAWRRRLDAPGVHLNVGISWRGGGQARTRASRSVALETLRPLFALPGVRFIDVQYGEHETTAPLVRFDDVDPLRDMDGFAALLSALDLVISVDNSTVHLAGALGVATWMLCPLGPEWRWENDGETSYWYRSLRLFRQRRPGDAGWVEVIENIADALGGFKPSSPALLPPAASTACVLEPLRPTVLLVNDGCYWEDFGNACASLALHEQLRAKGHAVESIPTIELQHLDAANIPAPLLQRIEAAPGLVVRWETRYAPVLLALVRIAAQRLGKPVAIAQESHDPADAAALATAGATLLPAEDYIARYVAAHPPVRATRNGGQRRIVLAGTNAWLGDGQKRQVAALHSAGRCSVTITSSEAEWLAMIASAGVLLNTGPRYEAAARALEAS